MEFTFEIGDAITFDFDAALPKSDILAGDTYISANFTQQPVAAVASFREV